MTKKSALTTEYPAFEANGVKHTLRPLGLGDVTKVVRLLSKVAKGVPTKTYKTQKDMIMALVMQATEMDDEIFGVLADVIGVTKEELVDPHKFPIDSAIDMFEAFSEHPDLQRFFTKLAKVVENNENLQNLQKQMDGASKK